MRTANRKLSVVLIVLLLAGTYLARAETIDPDDDGSQYAWAENIGWLNAEPQGDGGPGITVLPDELRGWMWSENVGWISLSCENTSSCAVVDYGVSQDGNGSLAGWAWGENVGWISFSCDNTASCGIVDYGVRSAIPWLLFADGFESGDMSAWSNSVP